MKFSLFASLASAFLAVAASPVSRQAKPPAFFLAGDSTTAVNGGWGDGFIATLRNGAIGQNKGHGGANTASFVAGGDWGAVLNLVRNNKAKYDCYVTIQFGHNDQVRTLYPDLVPNSLSHSYHGLEIYFGRQHIAIPEQPSKHGQAGQVGWRDAHHPNVAHAPHFHQWQARR
jgi:hypothetical protein